MSDFCSKYCSPSLVFLHILTPTCGYAMGSDQFRQERNPELETKKLKTKQGRELEKEKGKGDGLVDYCAILGEDDIQGKKHGFLAGNKVKAIKPKHF